MITGNIKEMSFKDIEDLVDSLKADLKIFAGDIPKKFIKCSKCSGCGCTWIHGHGAFGEPEVSRGPSCSNCDGYGFLIRPEFLKKIQTELQCWVR